MARIWTGGCSSPGIMALHSPRFAVKPCPHWPEAAPARDAHLSHNGKVARQSDVGKGPWWVWQRRQAWPCLRGFPDPRLPDEIGAWAEDVVGSRAAGQACGSRAAGQACVGCTAGQARVGCTAGQACVGCTAGQGGGSRTAGQGGGSPHRRPSLCRLHRRPRRWQPRCPQSRCRPLHRVRPSSLFRFATGYSCYPRRPRRRARLSRQPASTSRRTQVSFRGWKEGPRTLVLIMRSQVAGPPLRPAPMTCQFRRRSAAERGGESRRSSGRGPCETGRAGHAIFRTLAADRGHCQRFAAGP